MPIFGGVSTNQSCPLRLYEAIASPILQTEFLYCYGFNGNRGRTWRPGWRIWGAVMEPAEQFTFQPTNEQQEIIGFRGGNLQITACAGSGKTETVSQRVASLIFEGVEPQSIIAFTFTERAAASLKSRIFRRVEDKMGSAITGRLPQLYVGTIHAYCLKLLQEHVPQYQDFDILDDHQHAALLSREHLRLNLSRIRAGHWAPIRDFIRNADVVENELIDPNRLPNTGFGACYRDYKKTLENYRFLTYGQLIAAAVNALTDPSIFERIHSPLRHFIVKGLHVSHVGAAPLVDCLVIVSDDAQLNRRA